jgi:hypothetical protein
MGERKIGRCFRKKKSSSWQYVIFLVSPVDLKHLHTFSPLTIGMPKHEKKKKKRRDHSRHVLDLNELKELAKAHRHKDKAEIKKKSEDSMSKAAMVPQTKAEHDKEQNVVRKVVDPLTGRTRSVTYAMDVCVS